MRTLRWLTLVLGCLLAAGPASAEPVHPYVIGGTPSAAGAMPFAAFVQVNLGGGYFGSCSGSVVAPTLVLTAAHCVLSDTGQPLPPGQFLVSTGSVSYATGVVSAVSTVRVYPYIALATLSGDAALLTLSAPVAAPPVRLATTADAALYVAGQPAVIAGWGLTDPAAAMIPAALQQGTVSVLSNAACKLADPLFSPVTNLCAAGPAFHPAACSGDSGGPLVVGAPGSYVQIGIVSYGLAETCATTNDYYARVSTVQPWIASVIAGTPVPPAFHPAFVAPATAAATLNADGIAVAFPAAAADPASILTGYVVTLRDGAGATLLSQVLPPTAISAAFPTLQPGVFSVTVVATYSEGASAPVLSAPVTLAPPTNTVRPALAGPGIVGTRLSCAKGTWSWPGTSTLSTEWLRGKKPIGVTGASYRLVEADAGKPITCAVTLRAATGPTARAESAPVVAELELQKTRSPRVRGSAVVGATLTCSTGTWKHTGLLVFSYRWLRDGKLTGKPSQRTLIVAAIDAGHRIACRVTAVAGKQKESAVSAGVLAAAA